MLLPTILLLVAAVLHPSLGQGGSGTSPEAQEEIVNKHNEMRRNVNPTARNMVKMGWSEPVAENAKKRADECQFEPSPIEKKTVNGMVCGENIYMASFENSWLNIIEAWRDRGISNFKYGVGAIDPNKDIGGFTQIIWYNSYQVGCARAHCPDKTYPYLSICQYCPAGNIVGRMAKPYKEGPSCGDCPNNCENKLCTNPCKYADDIANCKQMLQQITCKDKLMIEKCAATCNCKTEIK